MSDTAIEIETGPAPAASVVVLHGLGADGRDFVPIASELDLSAVGPVRWVFPHAPMRPVTINGGHVMRAWYDIVVSDLGRREDEAGLRASRDAVDALIARERSRGVESRRIVVAGFSQGCAMALMTGLRHPERLAGIVGLSGYLPIAATTAGERSEANRDTPVFLAHGSRDPVVAIERGRASRDALEALGHPVEWHEYPIEHTVSLPELMELRAFLLRVLG
ncbi:MAG TPA: alpha/beta hydrolase [Burkholderiaceae bacterium]|nr:alpha/beta hydrolase [Burkholderiaceae bacterium]